MLALSGGHTWVDGSAAITSAVWGPADTLVITLSDTTSDPTVAVGDTITLDGATIDDALANNSSTAASPAITGTFSSDTTAPTITARDTVDLDGDGWIDALHISFDEPIDDTSVIAANFDVAGVAGEAFSSTTNGDTADDADIYITFDENGFGTSGTPDVAYTEDTLSDLSGNTLASVAAASGFEGAVGEGDVC